MNRAPRSQTNVPPNQAVTVCVIARDAAGHLAALLPTLQWSDEVLVVLDDRTVDRSAAVAASWDACLEILPFESFPSIRNRALARASHPWVLFVDADERVTSALAAEIRVKLQETAGMTTSPPVGFWIPRRNRIFGRNLVGGGWWPDEQLRLLQRDRVSYDPRRLVHELVVCQGPTGVLTTPLLHFNYDNLGQFVQKQASYTALEAATLRSEGVYFRRRALVGQPLREFHRRYVTLRGHRDGLVGLLLAGAMAYFAFRRVLLTRQPPEPLQVRDLTNHREE